MSTDLLPYLPDNRKTGNQDLAGFSQRKRLVMNVSGSYKTLLIQKLEKED